VKTDFPEPAIPTTKTAYKIEPSLLKRETCEFELSLIGTWDSRRVTGICHSFKQRIVRIEQIRTLSEPRTAYIKKQRKLPLGCDEEQARN